MFGKSRGLIIAVFFTIGIIFVIQSLNSNLNNDSVKPLIENVSKVLSTPTPTPFPFDDLTIPYLRKRTYTSSLELKSTVLEDSEYDAYYATYVSDGLNINGLLTIPNSIQPAEGFPAIVFVHGYIRPSEYFTTRNYNSYVDYLASRGYVVFKIDLRGHADSDGEAGGGYYSSDYVIDTLNAYAALSSSDFIDEKRIGLWGHSMAGNIVLRSIAAKKDIPAAVIWAGAGYTYSDLQDYRISDSSYQPPSANSERAKKRQQMRDLYGDFSKDHWFWKQVPATNYLDEVTSALQLIHAQDDNVVRIEYSRNLSKILDSTKIIHELKEFTAGGHNLSGSTFTPAMQATVEFLQKNL